MSVLYGDEAVRHRLTASEAKVVVTDTANAPRFENASAEMLLVEEGSLAGAPTDHICEPTSADDPAQLYHTSATTGLAKAIEAAGSRYPQTFRRVCSAGEPLNPEAIRWFRDHYGVTVLDFYGLTESYPLVANYPFLDVREGSMGLPMPGWDVQLLDDDEQPVERGTRGEICLRARSNPHYPLGYWRNEEAGRETFDGEWFHTKDAAV